MTDGT